MLHYWLGMLFLAFVIISGLGLYVGYEYFKSYKASLNELFDRFFSNQFLTVNASHMVWAYFIGLIMIPITISWLGFPWFVSVLLIVVILFSPRCAFSIVENKRRQDIVNALPDALQQIGAALRAGATFNSALDALVTEYEGPIAQEFSLVLREQKMGTRLDDSLEDLGDRVKSEDIDITVSAILIAQDVGGNLAEVLTRLADTLRSKISMEERIRSLTAQGVMQGYVVTALPTFIILALFLLEREAIMPLFTSLLGWLFLAAVLIMQSLGGWFIRKIVTIDI